MFFEENCLVTLSTEVKTVLEKVLKLDDQSRLKLKGKSQRV